MPRTITIKETANTIATPNYVVLSFTIEATEKKYASAVESVAEKIQQLNMTLMDTGLEKDSVKTVSYVVRPNYNYVQDRKGKVQNVLEGYMCVHRLKIEFFYDTELLSKALEAISACLANPQLDISFTLKDKEAVKEELLKLVASNAKKKAETICITAGATLGKLITVEYHKDGVITNSNFGRLSGDTCELALPVPSMSMPGMSSPSVPQVAIQPKDINISDSATFVWEIE